MAHLTARGKPCGLPDGHKDAHRTEQGVANHRAAMARYEYTPAGRARKMEWNRRNPVVMELASIRYQTRSKRERAAS